MSRGLERTTSQYRLPFDQQAVGESSPAGALVPPGPVAAPAAETATSAPRAEPFPAQAAEPQLGSPPATVQFVRHARARRFVIRVLPDGTVRVTVPRSGSRKAAEAFLARSQAWIARQHEKLRRSPTSASRALADGDLVLLRGVPTQVRLDRANSRMRLMVGDLHALVAAPSDGDLRPLAGRVLRAAAARELPPRLRELAARHRLRVSRVTVRDQQSRWGSCARSGSISLNWRLVQMPPEVRDYVLLHELMHLREANHSTRFWKHVNAVCPWHYAARRWLAREGRGLL